MEINWIPVCLKYSRTAATIKNASRENQIANWHLTMHWLTIPVSMKTTRTFGLHVDHATNTICIGNEAPSNNFHTLHIFFSDLLIFPKKSHSIVVLRFWLHSFGIV